MTQPSPERPVWTLLISTIAGLFGIALLIALAAAIGWTAQHLGWSVAGP